MTIQEFGKLYGVSELKLNQSTLSDRLIGNVISEKGEFTVITKPPFSKEEPIFVYPTEVADKDTGEINTIIVLSNKAPKAPVMVINF